MDFTTFTEVDEDSAISKTSSTITVVNAYPRQKEYYVYKDMGTGYWNADFEINVDVYIGPVDDNALFIVFMLSNFIGDAFDHQIGTKDYLKLQFYRSGASYTITFQERNSASVVSDYGTFTASTNYYFTIKRDEAVGTYGTAYCYVYSDSDREILIDTLTITLTEKQDFRYIYGFSVYNNENDSAQMSCNVSNLELIDPMPSASISPSPSVSPSISPSV